LKQLQARKRELLLESELNRQVWRVELGRLHFRAEQFQRGYNWVHSAWAWTAPVAGFLLARKFTKTAGVFAKGSLLMSALRTAWKFWEARKAPPTRPSP
jgi:hypothetical protein